MSTKSQTYKKKSLIYDAPLRCIWTTTYSSQENVCHPEDGLKACHEFEDVNFATNTVTC